MYHVSNMRLFTVNFLLWSVIFFVGLSCSTLGVLIYLFNVCFVCFRFRFNDSPDDKRDGHFFRSPPGTRIGKAAQQRRDRRLRGAHHPLRAAWQALYCGRYESKHCTDEVDWSGTLKIALRVDRVEIALPEGGRSLLVWLHGVFIDHYCSSCR